jgi:hypothetical protein
LRTKSGTEFHNRIATPKQLHKEKNLLKRNNNTINSWQQKNQLKRHRYNLLMKTNKTNKHTIQVLHCDNKIRLMIYQWEILYRNEGRAGASLAHLFSLYLNQLHSPSPLPPKKIIRKIKSPIMKIYVPSFLK